MRFFIHLTYNGSSYVGWQKQPNGISVQQMVEDALHKLTACELDVTGCGRTDAGVHARSYYAHIDTEPHIVPEDLNAFCHRLNAVLPSDIRVFDIVPVEADAHARYSAISRTYEYHLLLERNPFKSLYASVTPYSLNLEYMQMASIYLLGTHDFTSFARLHGSSSTNICSLTQAKWEQEGELLIFTITANRFLRNMVRAIVGTLIDIGRGKYAPEHMEQVLLGLNRSKAGASAPAKGLSLTHVEYPKSIFLSLD